MFKRSKTISKEIILRKKYIKNELKNLVLKSIIQNSLIQYKSRILGLIFCAKVTSTKYFKTKQNNVCVASGKKKTTFKVTGFSRFVTKKYSELGLITNLKR